MRLHIGKNHQGQGSPVESVFRLAGDDEDALTFALGYLMAHDSAYCTRVLRACGIALPRSFGHDYSVHLQEVTDRSFGRRDVVVEGGKTRVVLEAKVGGAVPTAEQLVKYSLESDLWGNYTNRAIVALTQVPLPDSVKARVTKETEKSSISLFGVQWHEIIDVTLRHRPSMDTEVSRHFFREFGRFVRRDYRMGYHDAEVLIQDVNRENATIFEKGWMYVTGPKDKKAPLYFAPYYTKELDNDGIGSISKVIAVEIARLDGEVSLPVNSIEDKRERRLHGDRWTKGLELLRERASREGFSHFDRQLLFLGSPMRIFEPPLTKRRFKDAKLEADKGIPHQIPKGFAMSFDRLLRAGLRLSS